MILSALLSLVNIVLRAKPVSLLFSLANNASTCLCHLSIGSIWSPRSVYTLSSLSSNTQPSMVTTTGDSWDLSLELVPTVIKCVLLAFNFSLLLSIQLGTSSQFAVILSLMSSMVFPANIIVVLGLVKWLNLVLGAGFLRFRRFFWHPYWPCHLCHLSFIPSVINDGWLTWMTDDISDKVNMGVYKTVWTSGIQPLIPNLIITSFPMKIFENTQTQFFPLLIFKFLCIF